MAKPKPKGELADLRDKWMPRLDDEDKAHKQFRDLAKQANEEYFAVAAAEDAAIVSCVSYPLFWSIVNVLHGRIFSQPPKPDVRKRNQDETAKKPDLPPAASPQAAPAPQQPGQPPQPQAPPQPPPMTVDDNKIAQCLERAISFVIDTTNFDADGHAAVNDLLVVGLGQAKVEMDVETQDIPVPDPTTGENLPELDDDGQPVLDEKGHPKEMMQTIVTDQALRLRHFAWNQFRWEPQQHWSQVSWVAFDHWMTKDEIFDHWNVTLDVSTGSSTIKAGGGSGVDEKKPQADKYERLFRVSEIWNKPDRTRLYICQQHPEALEVTPDPLGLKDFFPCPKPMMLNIKGDDLVPQPDYSKCESLFKTANTIYGRIDSLTRQVKDVGFYDSSFPELASLTTTDDGGLVPIANITKRFADINPGAQGYNSFVFKQDNSEKVKTIQLLLSQLQETENDIWKAYGVSDIQRGATNPDETATAQSIKAQWADIRVGQRIRIVALFFRDVFRIMADVLSQFKPEMLAKMTGIELNPLEIEVLISDINRSFAVDVESDSTVVQDEFSQQQQRMAFMDSVTKYLEVLGPAMQQNQIPADLGKELLLCVVNSFKTGRQIEDAINNLPGTMQQLNTLNQQLQQANQSAQQMQKQLQMQQKALQAVNQQKEQRENIKTSVDAGKTQADTEHTEVETARIAQDIAHQAASPHPSVVPFPQPGRPA